MKAALGSTFTLIATGWTWRRATNAGALILALANAIISYDALAASARSAGLHGVFSWLFPLATDGIIVVATPAQLALRRSDAPRWVRTQIDLMLWAAIVFSVIGNASRASSVWSGVTVYVVPLPSWSAVWLALAPLAYAGALHVLGLVHQYPPAANGDARADAARLREELAEALSALERLRARPTEVSGGQQKTRRRSSGSGQRRRPASETLELVRVARDELETELGRKPSDEEIAARMTEHGNQLAASRVRFYLPKLRVEDLPEREGVA